MDYKEARKDFDERQADEMEDDQPCGCCESAGIVVKHLEETLRRTLLCNPETTDFGTAIGKINDKYRYLVEGGSSGKG